jgi:murein DD-endopeptidase MepM/ murein hydrolase activator NlpD
VATATPAALIETPTVPPAAVCSPLEGLSLSELPALISNPYHPPRSGSDDPHHGLDLADTLNPNRVALSGRGVQAITAGRVAAVMADRFPYGNALIIETALEDIPPVALFMLPTPAPTIVPPALTCPPFAPERAGDPAKRSVYVLYAHMLNPPQAQVGDAVTCGQPLGNIGQSGNALNPHLHIEVRAGPSGARPGSLAHYTDSATLEEMAAYCAWRVSGLFAMTDPMLVLAGGE